MADVGAVTNTAEDFMLKTQKRSPTNQMDKDAFLKILLAQLQNQDPTSPMENADMMAQMASFSQLESMQAIAANSNAAQVYGMIGKGIVGVLRDEATGAVTDVIGLVDSAGVEAGKPYVKVGNAMVWLEDISQVFDGTVLSGDSSSILAGTSMVGKYVRAEFTNGTDAPSYMEGLVERVSVRDGRFFVTVDGAEVGLYQIVNVAATPEALGTV